jgi:hypothetical protein
MTKQPAPPAPSSAMQLAQRFDAFLAEFAIEATDEQLDDNECAHCGDHYELSDGCDPSSMCWNCGHDALVTLIPLLRQAASLLSNVGQAAEPARAVASSADALAKAGVYLNADCLDRFVNCTEFWDRQPHNTRFYFGPSLMDYVHRGILEAAVKLLAAHPQGAADGDEKDAQGKSIKS